MQEVWIHLVNLTSTLTSKVEKQKYQQNKLDVNTINSWQKSWNVNPDFSYLWYRKEERHFLSNIFVLSYVFGKAKSVKDLVQ